MWQSTHTHIYYIIVCQSRCCRCCVWFLVLFYPPLRSRTHSALSSAHRRLQGCQRNLKTLDYGCDRIGVHCSVSCTPYESPQPGGARVAPLYGFRLERRGMGIPGGPTALLSRRHAWPVPNAQSTRVVGLSRVHSFRRLAAVKSPTLGWSSSPTSGLRLTARTTGGSHSPG